MSADAWWVCKICNPNESYDKEFLHPMHGTIETVRVDYQHWLNEKGEFCFNGSAHCEKCGRLWQIDVSVLSNKELKE